MGVHATSVQLRLWPLMVLLLARAYKKLEELSRHLPPGALCHGGQVSGRAAPASQAWCGLAYAWQPPTAGNSRHGWVEVLQFPALLYELPWLHSQHGTLRCQGGGNAFTEVGTVQLDAKFSTQADCFSGHWMEHQSYKQLPARVFRIDSQYGGLQRWMAAVSTPA